MHVEAFMFAQIHIITSHVLFHEQQGSKVFIFHNEMSVFIFAQMYIITYQVLLDTARLKSINFSWLNVGIRHY